MFRSQKALANIHPLVLRIDDVGHAEALDFRDFAYRPKEVENKYYLSRWTELYFGRNRYTIQRDFTNSLYFMNADVQRAVVEDYRKNKTIDAFVRDSSILTSILKSRTSFWTTSVSPRIRPASSS